MRRREFIAGVSAVVATLPIAAAAQQLAAPVIGFLSWGSATASQVGAPMAAFRRGLAEQGYVSGRNLTILFRWAEFRQDVLPGMTADLIGRGVALIVTSSGLAPALAAKAATTTVPIVFQMGADPVEVGLVSNLNHPGGNVTGATFLAQPLVAKRLEMLHEAVPGAASIAYLVNPGSPATQVVIREAENAARRLRVRLAVLNAMTSSEVDAAFVALDTQGIGAICIDTDAFFTLHIPEIAALATRHRVPALFGFRDAVEVGGLMSYSADINEAYYVAGSYAGRILKGEKPADLPVQLVTKIELTINMNTAKALGITFPQGILGRADRVIE
jgi:putative tryptophan/tyrosine transport system substrate-binding protein